MFTSRPERSNEQQLAGRDSLAASSRLIFAQVYLSEKRHRDHFSSVVFARGDFADKAK